MHIRVASSVEKYDLVHHLHDEISASTIVMLRGDRYAAIQSQYNSLARLHLIGRVLPYWAIGAFANLRIHMTPFSHQSVCSPQNVGYCGARGVEIVYTNNQTVVNIIIPIRINHRASLRNTTCPLDQSEKDDARYSIKMYTSLRSSMRWTRMHCSTGHF